MSDHDLDGRVALAPVAALDTKAGAPARSAPAGRDAVDRVACKLGDASCALAHAAAIDRSGGVSARNALQRLQRSFGNRYVGAVLSRAHAGEDGLDAVERGIEQSRGGGQGLDDRTRVQMESSFGADFSAVRIHTDSRADGLNQSLSARAFATGPDIYFRQGEYDPGSSAGRELLAHELTHVVQQGGAPIKAKLTVSQPDDAHELEADRVAKAVMQREAQSSAPEEDEEKEMAGRAAAVQRQPETTKPDDEEEAGPS